MAWWKTTCLAGVTSLQGAIVQSLLDGLQVVDKSESGAPRREYLTPQQ